MALIRCPECGREISDKASACPGCGCPVEEFGQEEQQKAARELPPEERPEMMECVKCGRKIPTTIAECPFCNYVYGTYRERKDNASVFHQMEKLNNAFVINGTLGKRIEIINDKFMYYIGDKLMYNSNVYEVKIKSKKEPGKLLGGNVVFKVHPILPAVDFSFASRGEYNKFFSIFSSTTEKEIKAEQAAQKLQKRTTVHCPKCGSVSIQYTNKKLSIGRAIVGDAFAGPAGAVLGGLSSKKGYAVCMNCGKRWKV